MNLEICQITFVNYEKDIEFDGHLIAHFSITYPKILETGKCIGIKKINVFYKRLAKIFKKYCLNRVAAEARREFNMCRELEVQFVPFRASLECSATYNDGRIISFITDRFEILGSICRFQSRYSETWKVKGGYILSLKELVPKEIYSKAKLASAAFDSAAENMRKGSDLYYPDIKKLLVKYFSCRNFYLQNSSVFLYYQPLTVAPREEGIAVFKVCDISGISF